MEITQDNNNCFFQAIEFTTKNYRDRYGDYNLFLNENPYFNPNGSNEYYENMWAIRTIIDTSYSNMSIDNYYEQDKLILRLIEEFDAFVDYSELLELLIERNKYKTTNIPSNLLIDFILENNKEDEIIYEQEQIFKNKRKCK